MYICYVNTVAKARLFAAVFSQLTIFTADCLRHPIQDDEYRNHMGVAHSYCLGACLPHSKLTLVLEYFSLVLMSTDPAVSLNSVTANITAVKSDDSESKCHQPMHFMLISLSFK